MDYIHKIHNCAEWANDRMFKMDKLDFLKCQSNNIWGPDININVWVNMLLNMFTLLLTFCNVFLKGIKWDYTFTFWGCIVYCTKNRGLFLKREVCFKFFMLPLMLLANSKMPPGKAHSKIWLDRNFSEAEWKFICNQRKWLLRQLNNHDVINDPDRHKRIM